MFVILRNEGSCPFGQIWKFIAKETQNVRVCLSSWGTKDLVLWSLSCHPEERRILLFGLWVIILRNEGSCPWIYGLIFFAKEAQNDCIYLSSWGTKDLALLAKYENSSQKKLRMTVVVCHPEEWRILPFGLWTKILRKRSSEWQWLFVILTNTSSTASPSHPLFVANYSILDCEISPIGIQGFN